jgi:hypothetical protein
MVMNYDALTLLLRVESDVKDAFVTATKSATKATKKRMTCHRIDSFSIALLDCCLLLAA